MVSKEGCKEVFDEMLLSSVKREIASNTSVMNKILKLAFLSVKLMSDDTLREMSEVVIKYCTKEDLTTKKEIDAMRDWFLLMRRIINELDRRASVIPATEENKA